MYTIAQLNSMLAKAREMLLAINVPISESICPNIVLAKSHSFYGQCCGKNSSLNKSRYQFQIRISAFTLDNSEKSMMNTLLHELIHTVPGGHGHRGQWLRWANYVRKCYGYDIRRCDGDKSSEDRHNLVKDKRVRWIRFVIVCPHCHLKWEREKRTVVVMHPERYKCPKCNGPLQRIR